MFEFGVSGLLRSTFIGIILSISFLPVSYAQQDRAELLRRAQRFINTASRRYAAEDFEAALQALRQAEILAEQVKDPSLASVRFNIARCLERLGRDQAALKAYQRYELLPDAEHRKQKAFAAIRNLEKKVFAVLSIVCSPDGALIFIPGLTSGNLPCPWHNNRVQPGTYTIEFSAPNYETESRVVELSAGQARSVQVSLTRVAEPHADISTSIEANASVKKRDLPIWPILALGAGAGVAGLGGAFTALAANQRSTVETTPPGQTQDDALNSFRTFRTLSIALYSVGGALAAGGVVLFFVPEKKDDPTTARLIPGPTGFTVHF